MKSYTTLRNLAGSLSDNKGSANLTLLDQLINDGHRKALRSVPHLLETSTTFTTTASTQFYELPYNFGRLINATVTIGTTKYSPIEITSRKQWDELNATTSVTSNTPEYFFIFDNQIGLYPTPASTTANAITIVYEKRIKDLSVADYTTGGILTATNGSTAIVGTGTTWTAAMAGRFLRITDSDTANKGDGEWYEISSSGSATTITLVKAYNGTSISAGNAAYTIGQMPLLPEDYHDLPVSYALSVYFQKQGNAVMAALYETKWRNGLQELKLNSQKSTNVVLDNGSPRGIINPNLTLTL